jgi:hypothetical protein
MIKAETDDIEKIIYPNSIDYYRNDNILFL